jgi:adenine-specific DNA-methyltransferase
MAKPYIPAKPPYCVHACLTDEIALNDLNSMNIINIREKPEFVLGVLNSRLVSWWFVHKFGKMQRETFPQFKVNELADFPLPQNRTDRHDEIAKLVKEILGAKRHNPEADTKALEREIDQLVYKLYDLTADEIKLVEEASRTSMRRQSKEARTAAAASSPPTTSPTTTRSSSPSTKPSAL